MCQSAVYSTVSFCRGCLGAVTLFMGNCVRSNTSQNAVFPFPFWHILQLLLHICSLFSRSLTILFWRRRAGLRPWCTGRVTGRRTWRWWLQGEKTVWLYSVLSGLISPDSSPAQRAFWWQWVRMLAQRHWLKRPNCGWMESSGCKRGEAAGKSVRCRSWATSDTSLSLTSHIQAAATSCQSISTKS